VAWRLSQVGNVGPDLGQSYIIDSFLVVVLGGVGQLAGGLCGPPSACGIANSCWSRRSVPCSARSSSWR
jgi:branched-subunit amino acid ABC-type transport system permease component